MGKLVADKVWTKAQAYFGGKAETAVARTRNGYYAPTETAASGN